MDLNMQANKSPLCVFCLSPPFAVLPYQSSVIPAPKRPAFFSLRRGECSYPRIKPRFKKSLRRGTEALTKYLVGRVKNRRRETNLQEVLGTLKQVWIAPNKYKSTINSKNDMDKKPKINSNLTSEKFSPVFLRRRLSAPETIMRKHMLAQQRADSQDSDATQVSECKSCQLCMDIGSDSNLSKKKDAGFMRKSTLLRRLWSNGKPLTDRDKRFSGSYSEWQYSCGKLSAENSTHSLNSNYSSPEHFKSSRSLSGEEFRISPKHSTSLNNSRKVSPKHAYEQKINFKTIASPRRKSSVGNYQDLRANYSNASRESTSSLTTTENRMSTTTPKTTESDTTTRRTETSTTNYSDNSDSAYTNSQSNFTSNNNSETTYSSGSQRYAKEINETLPATEFHDVRNNNAFSDPEIAKHFNQNESSTQTADTANLNVISNVQLSQATLNLIFNQVLQDVQNKQPTVISIKTLSATLPVKEEEEVQEPTVINVKQMPSFYLNRKEDVIISPEHNRIIKYMISNVGAGSPYSKPAEVPQIVVPRFSALPRTASMEVNTSSGDSTDKESDTISLVDSLEDPMSPRSGNVPLKHDDKPVRGSLSILLPDNSDKRKNKTPLKPAAFFIPIESDKTQEIKSVADHLPAKVKEKLSKRQLKREQKLHQVKSNLASPRSDSNYISASDTNQVTFSVTNSDYVETKCAPTLPNVTSKTKKKPKTILPSIEAIRRLRKDPKDSIRYAEHKDNISKLKPKSFSKYDKCDNSPSNVRIKPTSWAPKSRPREDLCEPLPRRIYHKTELNNEKKRVEILEIMEWVDDEERQQNFGKGKSKIPVLVQHKLPKIDRKSQKPIYLDFQKVHALDPKIDQLIANILIDTLNNTGNSSDDRSHALKVPNDNRASQYQMQSKISKYQQKFEVIPEELSLQSSVDDNVSKKMTTNGNVIGADSLTENRTMEESNNNSASNEINKNQRSKCPYKGKEAVSMDDDLLSIPQGWITFYMLHKNQGSPDSTSDEGPNKSHKIMTSKAEHEKTVTQTDPNGDIIEDNSEESHIQVKERQIPFDYDDYKIANRDIYDANVVGNVSSNDAFSDNLNPSSTSNIGRFTKKNLFRKNNKNCDISDQHVSGGWSVTVSGTNGYGHLAPDVEMRLKFPPTQYSNQYNSDSGFGDERFNANAAHLASKRACHLPKRRNHQQNICGFVADAVANEDDFKNGRLPLINQKVQNLSKRCDSGSLVPVQLEPRQTKTSTRRYTLNRPRSLPRASPNLNKDFFLNLNAEKQLAAILNRFPEILSVSGNGICPEQKPRVPTMSERDLTRHLYANPR